MSDEDPSKILRLLLAFFGESRLPECREIAPSDVPPPFHSLLVHDNHMTVTLEEYFGKRVIVRPYQVHRVGDLYGRKLDLLLEGNGRVVMTGAMLFNLSTVSPEVGALILEQKTPLGRILIEHDILRTISGGTYVRIEPTDPLAARFGNPDPVACYGRLATIFCDGKPAVDLLEIVTPTA
ncbi:MAG: hypothetical protein U1D30_14020 [Planctomycetota bacterium]